MEKILPSTECKVEWPSRWNGVIVSAHEKAGGIAFATRTGGRELQAEEVHRGYPQ